MKPKENYPPGMEYFKDKALVCLPAEHPANEVPMLTELQRAYLPALLWLFDVDRNRGTGRSTLFAHVLIELAIRGEEVKLEDLSRCVRDRTGYQRSRIFAENVLRIAHTCYPGYRFEYLDNQNTLRIAGRRPR